MPVVFDEIVAEVAPERAAPPSEPVQPAARRQEQPQDLHQQLRRLARRDERLNAD